jgi:hypothetical protein
MLALGKRAGVPSGYAVQELRDDSHGCYWYVVTALEVMRTNRH